MKPNPKLVIDLSYVSEVGLRAIEEVLLEELVALRDAGDDAKHDDLQEELRKLEDHFENL